MNAVLTFILLATTWVVFSGIFDVFHLGAGLLCVLLVTFTSGCLWQENGDQVGFGETLGRIVRLTLYSCWLLWQIVLANLHVIKLACSARPKEVINPQIVKFKTNLKSDFARFLLAHSITLTPGTVTIRIVDDEFSVHAISDMTAAGVPGEMESRLLKVFGEDTA